MASPAHGAKLLTDATNECMLLCRDCLFMNVAMCAFSILYLYSVAAVLQHVYSRLALQSYASFKVYCGMNNDSY